MTGTLQALSFSLRPARTLPYRRRHSHFPATHVDLLSSHTFNSKPSPLLLRKPSSIPGPIRVANHSDQVNGDGKRAPMVPDSATASNWMRNLSIFASDNFLPLALVGGVLFGLANPSLGCLADRYYVSKLSTFGIFIISGLTLRSDEIGAAAEAWPVGIFGLGSILLFTPFFSRFILQLQLQPQEFVTGLTIFSCMPTTLSSGVALTRLLVARSGCANRSGGGGADDHKSVGAPSEASSQSRLKHGGTAKRESTNWSNLSLSLSLFLSLSTLTIRIKKFMTNRLLSRIAVPSRRGRVSSRF